MFNSIETSIIESIKECIVDTLMSSISDLYRMIITNPFSITIEIIENNISSFINTTTNFYKSLIEYFINTTFDSIIVEKFKSLYLDNGIHLYAFNKKPKVILTSVGKLKLVRSVLRCKNDVDCMRLKLKENKNSIIPLDKIFKMKKNSFQLSNSLLIDIAFYGISMSSYEKAKKVISKHFHFDISEETIRKVTNHVGKILYNYETQIANNVVNTFSYHKETKNTKDFAIIEMDGCFIQTISKNESGIGGIEKVWAEVKSAFVSSSDNIVVSKIENDKIKLKPKTKFYTCYLGKYEDFKKYVISLYVKQQLDKYNDTIIIGDGAPWIKSFKNEFFPNGTLILDFYHLSQRVYEFAEYVYKDHMIAKDVANMWCRLLLKGHWRLLLDLIKDFKDKKLDNGVINLYTYLYNNRHCINYPYYISKYFFIGSGAIESANKFVVQARLKLAGMKWKRENAQSILSLRAKECSNCWDEVYSILYDYLLLYYEC